MKRPRRPVLDRSYVVQYTGRVLDDAPRAGFPNEDVTGGQSRVADVLEATHKSDPANHAHGILAIGNRRPAPPENLVPAGHDSNAALKRCAAWVNAEHRLVPRPQCIHHFEVATGNGCVEGGIDSKSSDGVRSFPAHVRRRQCGSWC